MSGNSSNKIATKTTMSDNQEEYKPRIHRIRIWPDDEVLHEEAEEVTVFAKGLKRLAQDMLATMVANQGIGLAAPQIGIKQKIIAIRIEDGNPLIFVNPKIVHRSEEMFSFEEGCLSVPGYFEERDRPKEIIVEFQDVTGQEHRVFFNDLYAFAIQHEYDHLMGKVFVDDVSWFKKNKVKKKIKKAYPEQHARAMYAKSHLDDWWGKLKEVDNKEDIE